MKVPVVLDTDLALGAVGSEVDDGFALAMAVADPGIDLRLVTTVAGNTAVDDATRLSRQLLERLGGGQPPVIPGAGQPLLAAAGPNPAVDAMIDVVLAAPGEITVVAIGPLTNLALALRSEPRFAASLGDVVIMGGRFTGPGADAEFNVRSDPEAAQVVLDAPLEARWVGLDVTLQVRISRSEAAAMAASERPFEAFAGEYTTAWIDQPRHPGDDPESCALHDPLAVAVVTRPELVQFEPRRVSVGLGRDERGIMTVRDGPPNARIGVAVDAAGFTARFTSLLARLS